MTDKNKSNDIAISVKNVSKTFRIPHEKITSVRGAVVNAFKTGGYEEFKALDDVSFEVKKGEFFGIIGRNGSGKSTLLKILAGIYQADKGKVRIHGMISPFLELGIGFNPELSGRDNIYLNATVLGMTKKQIDKKFDDIVKFSELERFIDQKLKNYSSGMQVRLAFSVSIHANRDILLMDEVLAVGDSNFQSKCLEEFNKYRDMGRTVVIVTHDISVVERYCDRALLLRNGKIVKMGKADNVTTEYIKENMSDEERRIMKENEERKALEEKKRKEISKKEKERDNERLNGNRNKVAEIANVEFLNKNGKVKNVFKTGDDIVIRIFYEIAKNKIITSPCFGFAIYNEQDMHISGDYTKNSNFKIKPIKNKGYIDLEIDSNIFNSGFYYLTIAIYENNDSLVPLDRKVKLFKFKIISNNTAHGLLRINHNWIQDDNI